MSARLTDRGRSRPSTVHPRRTLVLAAGLLAATLLAAPAAWAQDRGARAEAIDVLDEMGQEEIFGEDASSQDYFMVTARPVYWVITFLLAAACGVLLFLKGGLRWIRFMCLGTMIEAVVGFGWMYSLLTSILAVIVVLVIGGLAAYYITKVWTKEVKPAVAQTPFNPPDSILLEYANAWSRDGETVGFRVSGEHIVERKISGEAKRSWLRLLLHKDSSCWAEIWATVSPKVLWLRLSSRLEDGRVVETSSRLTLTATFGDTGTCTRRVGKRTTIAEAYLAHQANIEESGGTPLRIDDPLTHSLRAEREWGERLVADGKMEQDGDLLRLPPKTAVTIFVQTAKALLLG